jgi:hypothetical protein
MSVAEMARMQTARYAAVLLVLGAGCGVTSPDDPTGVGSGSDPGGGGGTAPAEVYANSESALYRLDPTTKELARVGTFDCVSLTADPSDSLDGMTDIAADANGALYGIGTAPGGGAFSLFSIDRATAHCTALSALAGGVGGLTFAPAGVVDASAEVLLGVDTDGQLQRFDAVTGTAAPLGMAGGWLNKSADLVSIDGDRTYSTRSGDGGDHLIAIDPKTGTVLQDIGPTGRDGIFGLGYWGGTVYGFMWDGTLYAISTTTAEATEIAIPNRESGLRFVGAAVTTSAPIVLL